MIVDMPSTSTSKINGKLVELRESGGVLALSRVLTLVIVTEDGAGIEDAIDAANSASREHPCRVIVLARGASRAATRLDAQIRVGGDAGASEVIVLRAYGPLAGDESGASMVIPMLLPDTPVVAWWPGEAPAVPAADPIGRLAQRRVTDAFAAANPARALEQRRSTYVAGDTDLAWSRITLWRALLAAALDNPPYEEVTSAKVVGEPVSPSADLLAGWLNTRLAAPVKRLRSDAAPGIYSVRLERPSGPVELIRPDGKVGVLTQPGQPDRMVSLQRRDTKDILSEELRRLDADEIYAAALDGLNQITKGRSTVRTGAGARR